MIRAAKVDRNQPEIVKQLRQIGAYVLLTHQLKNCCDFFVGYRGRWTAFELKDSEKTESQTKLTAGEQKFFNDVGQRAPVYKVKTFEEILKMITK